MYCFLSTLIVLCIIALIKNQITYSIRKRWIDDIYHYRVDLRFSDLPDYDSVFLDLTLWRYVPLDKYLKK